jgi:arylsulfatase A-like enzyme
MEGTSFLPLLRDIGHAPSSVGAGDDEPTLYWEHCGNGAVRRGPWKLVREYPNRWELYNLATDPTELHDVADQNREIAEQLLADWSVWADRIGVLPFSRIEDLYVLRGEPAADAAG